MTTEMVTRHSEDHVECICGNQPHLDGFFVSDTDGTIRELGFGPEAEWDGETMSCWTCGRTFSLMTNEVVGHMSDEMLEGARQVVA
jgi:hypothetical protein